MEYSSVKPTRRKPRSCSAPHLRMEGPWSRRGVEYEEVEAVKKKDEEGDGGDAPEGSDGEAGEAMGAAEAEGGELAMLDAGHEPADEEEKPEHEAFVADHGGHGDGLAGLLLEGRGFGWRRRLAGFRGEGGEVLVMQVDGVANGEDAAEDGCEEKEVEEETPSSAKAERAGEEGVVRCGRRGGLRGGWKGWRRRLRDAVG